MTRCGARAAAAALLASALCPALFAALSPARAAEPLPVDPAVLAQAQAVKTLPCAGGGREGGFIPDEAAPPAWRFGATLISVRRRQGDRLAFVLAPPPAGAASGPAGSPAGSAAECPVRDVQVLPRGGSLLGCALQDDSVRGLGVHTMLPSGRRDLLFWRAEADGTLHRQGTLPDDDDFESDTGELICALPDLVQ